MESNTIKTLIEKLCKGAFPLEVYISHEGNQLSYKSIFLYTISDTGNLFAIDYLQPVVGNNYIFPRHSVQIAFSTMEGHYRFDTIIVKKVVKEKLILLALPTELEKFERRRYPRTYFNNRNYVKIRFNFYRGHPKFQERGWSGRLLDISRGGLAFTSDFVNLNNLVAQNDELEIVSGENKEDEIHYVRVVHVRHNNVCGCEFVSKDKIVPQEEDKKQIPTERRDFFRLKVPQSVQIKAELVIAEGPSIFGDILNISLGGVEIKIINKELVSKLSVNQNVTVKIDLGKLGKINSNASVIHIKDFSVGLKFDDLAMNKQDIVVIKFLRENLTKFEVIKEEKK